MVCLVQQTYLSSGLSVSLGQAFVVVALYRYMSVAVCMFLPNIHSSCVAYGFCFYSFGFVCLYTINYL